MYFSLRTLALGLAFGVAVDSTLAVGFGRLPTTAVLGQPLQLAIPLHLEPGEAASQECISGEVHFADVRQQAGTTSFKLDPAVPSATERVLRVHTTTRVDEPLVNVQVSVGCTFKVTRSFVLFADPPTVTVTEATASEPSAGVEEASTPAVSASASAPGDAPPAPSDALRADAPPVPSRASALAPREAATEKPRAAATAKVRSPARPARRVAQASTGSRLRLAPMEAGAVAPAAASPKPAAVAAAASAAAPEAAASSAPTAEPGGETAARARVAELEAAVGALRADTLAAQQSIHGLQLRLQHAEQASFSNPVVYALLALLALSFGALVWLWRQRNVERQTHAWNIQAATEGPVKKQADAAPSTAAAGGSALVPTLDSLVSQRSPVDGFDETRSLTRHPTSGQADFRASGSVPLGGVAPLSAAQRREVSVEELIDLEQQAEFFVVLGQDGAAIELLMGHLRSTAGSSPLPYLKLLEIHKRLDDRLEYERLRERFNKRFNAYAPAWETELLAGRSLEEYPAVIARLEGLWLSPQRALEVLEASLLKADGADSDDAQSESFDLPAYRELMLLYSIARDRSEAESGNAVDLALPLSEASAGIEGNNYGGVFERLLATTPLMAQPSAQRPLEVDLALDDIEAFGVQRDEAPALISLDPKRSDLPHG